jgi:excisionase family DNA binding protein
MSIVSCGLGDTPSRLLVTIADAQILLSLSRPTIYRMIAKGNLTAIKVLGTDATRIPMTSIESVLANSRKVGEAA